VLRQTGDTGELTRHYSVSRQTGTHIRLTTSEGGGHHVSIPRHHPLKVGTLSAILQDVAGHGKINKEELLERLLR